MSNPDSMQQDCSLPEVSLLHFLGGFFKQVELKIPHHLHVWELWPRAQQVASQGNTGPSVSKGQLSKGMDVFVGSRLVPC